MWQYNSAGGIEPSPVNRAEQFDRPISIGDRVVIQKEDVIAIRCGDRAIPRIAGTRARFDHITHGHWGLPRETLDHIAGLIGGIVVDDQAFRLGLAWDTHRGDTGESLRQQAATIAGRDGDGEFTLHGWIIARRALQPELFW